MNLHVPKDIVRQRDDARDGRAVVSEPPPTTRPLGLVQPHRHRGEHDNRRLGRNHAENPAEEEFGNETGVSWTWPAITSRF